MQVTVNGESQELPAGVTISDLLDVLGVHVKHVAVERNREVVPRADHPSTPLAEGDQLEVVTLVGGG